MPDPASPFILIRDVTRTFRMGEVEVQVLRGIDLELNDASYNILLGPSGSGKTTLLNLIGGIDRPDTGTIAIAGAELTAMSDAELTRFRRESVGFVFQFYNLVPSLTAIENVLVATELAEDPIDPAEALAIVEMTGRADHFPAQLSGGEQQRIAIARALASNPEILLCDEPTGALDLETGRRILATLDRVTEQLGKVVVHVTHNSAIAEMADRVVRLGSGRIVSVSDQESPTPALEVTW